MPDVPMAGADGLVAFAPFWPGDSRPGLAWPGGQAHTCNICGVNYSHREAALPSCLDFSASLHLVGPVSPICLAIPGLYCCGCLLACTCLSIILDVCSSRMLYLYFSSSCFRGLGAGSSHTRLHIP